MPGYSNHGCTLQTCKITNQYNPYRYQPSLVANSVYLALFSLSCILYLLQFFILRGGWAFTVAMLCGVTLEILGYAGRVITHFNPWDHNGYLIQIICLTIAPAFFAAGIYVTLNLVVRTISPASSRLRPQLYPRIFVSCDIVSLVLQAIGGGIAAAASDATPPKDPSVGNHILVAGIAFQVLTLMVFMFLAVDFALRARALYKVEGAAALGTKHAALRRSWYFKGFVAALALSTLCIFTRSVFRCAELGVGWQGYIIHDQTLFIALEGAMVVVAVLVLNMFHPMVCFGKRFDSDEAAMEEHEAAGHWKSGSDTPEESLAKDGQA